jgi:uncharacterized YkwD family protein
MKRKVFIVLALVAFMVLGVSGQALAASYPSWYRYFQYPWYGYQQPAKPAPKQPAPTQPAPTQPAPTQPAPTQPAGLSAEEQQMVNLVNQERAKAGLKPLAVDTRLVSLARLKSKDMIDKKYFSHQSPTYGSPFDMMKREGITYKTAGENLAGASTVTKAHQLLMQSAGHRQNILNPSFTHIGIGIVKGGPYGTMFTQMFIGK